MGYIVHFADLASFDCIDNFREACRYAKAGARDHRGASVYEDKGAYHGDVLRAWDDHGRRISVGRESAARTLGSRGGKASAAALSPEQRKERARKAVAARWARRRLADGQ